MCEDLRQRFRAALVELGRETPDMRLAQAAAEEPLVKALLREHARRAGGSEGALRRAVTEVCVDARAAVYVREHGREGVERLAAEEATALVKGRRAWGRVAAELKKAVERRG